MPVSALLSGYGVGDLGKGSIQFIDYMAECGFHIWQILPLNPLGYGNSPYQPYSSFAVKFDNINVGRLEEMMNLKKEDVLEPLFKEGVLYGEELCKNQPEIRKVIRERTLLSLQILMIHRTYKRGYPGTEQ